LAGDTDEELLEDGLWTGLLHDDCRDESKYRASKWISLAEHKELPLEAGIGDAGVLPRAAVDIVTRREKSVYWCCPTPARIKRWLWLREQILAEDKKRAAASK
jgi:hypothetical protein